MKPIAPSENVHRLSLIACALLFAACYSPDYGSGGFNCGLDEACPTGLVCLQGTCRIEGGSPPSDAPEIRIDWIRAHTATYNSPDEHVELWQKRSFQLRVEVTNFQLGTDGAYRLWFEGVEEFDGMHGGDEVTLDLPDTVGVGEYQLKVELLANGTDPIPNAIDGWTVQVVSPLL